MMGQEKKSEVMMGIGRGHANDNKGPEYED
jgi:hypothetical protein